VQRGAPAAPRFIIVAYACKRPLAALWELVVGKRFMSRTTKTTLTLEERRERRQLRREKQREDNVQRAAKMHAGRLKMEATSLQAATEPKAALFVGCSGWRYWNWRDSFYAEVPQPDWFKHYLKRFDTVEINASLLMAYGGERSSVAARARQEGVCLHRESLRAHYPCEEIQRYKNSNKRLRNDRRRSRRPNGLLPFSAAAELSLYQGTSQ
jgi:hypothetical protein